MRKRNGFIILAGLCLVFLYRVYGFGTKALDESMRDDMRGLDAEIFDRANNLKHSRDLAPALVLFDSLSRTNLKRSNKIYALNQMIFLALYLRRLEDAKNGFVRLQELNIQWGHENLSSKGDYDLNAGIFKFYKGGKPQTIDSLFNLAQASYRNIYLPNHIKNAQCLLWIGTVKSKIVPAAAQSYLEAAKEMYDREPEWLLGRPECEMELAIYFSRQRSFNESIRHCDEILHLNEEHFASDQAFIIQALICKAGALMKLKQMEEAMQTLHEAEQVAQESNAPETGEILKTIVQVYINADSSRELVFSKINEIENCQKQGKLLNDSLQFFLIGMFHLKKQHWSESIQNLETFIGTARGKQDQILQDQALFMLALAYQSTEQYDTAIRRLKTDLKLGYDEGRAPFHETGGLLYPDANEASEYEFTPFALMGRIFLKRYYKTYNIKDLKQASLIFSSLDTLYLSKMANKDEASLLGMQSEFVDSCYPAALEASYAYYKHANKKVWLNEAFRYCERIKSGIMFREMWSNQNGREGSYGSLKDSLSKINNRINRNLLNQESGRIPSTFEQAQLRALYKKRDHFDNELRRKSSSYVPNANESTPDISAIRKTLGPGEAIIQYGLGPEKLHILYIDIHHIEFIQTDRAKEIREKVKEFQTFLSQDEMPCERYVGVASALYDLLLGRISHRLGGVRKLLIIPDGALQVLPFDALVDVKKLKPTHQVYRYGYLPYLLLDYSITYSPSWKVHKINQEMAGGVAPDPELGIWIDTTIQPWSSTYFDSFSSVWGATHIGRFHDKTCTKREFISRFDSFDIIHIMVHGASSPDRKLDYKLYFAQEMGDSLFGYEVQNMRFQRTKLIVLAVCEGAEGKQATSEGPSNLTRSFMQAGIPWAIGGLFSIDEDASDRILIEFYKQLKISGDIALSLQKAKCSFLRDEQKQGGFRTRPYCWSGLIVQH